MVGGNMDFFDTFFGYVFCVPFVLFFVVLFSQIFISSEKIKKIVMRTYVIIFISIWCIGFFGGIALSNDYSSSSEEADGFTIESFNINLDVKEDNKVDVIENIVVNWTNANHHGIYRYIPNWLEYTAKDNKTIKRRSVVTNLKTDLEPYETDRVNKKDRIKIGYASKTVELGLHTYQIKYTYDMGSDPYSGFDEFIFHGFGDFWGTEIKNASMDITMPKSIENKDINFFMDKYRKENMNDYVNYTVNKNQLSLRFDSDKYYNAKLKEYCDDEDNLNDYGYCDTEEFKNNFDGLDKSLTVDISLPENYFTKGSYNYGFISIILIIISIIITILIIYFFIRYGKNNKKIARTIEFYPPDNLDSSEIGYIYNGDMDSKKLVISLLISLASKKYIKIDQKDKDIIFTNLNKWPKIKSGNVKHLIKINKLKDIDDNLTDSQKSLMNYIFRNGNNAELSSRFTTFDKYKDYLVNNGYIEITYDNTKEYEKEKKQLKEEYEKEYDAYIKSKRSFDVMTKNERVVYDALFENEDQVNLKDHTTFYKAFGKVSNNLENDIKDKIKDKVSHKHTIIAIVLSIITLALNYFSYFIIADMSPKLSILYTIGWICVPICFFFTIFMERRTVYGEKIKAEIKGFRHFLVTAEKEQLEAMVNSNPQYFYDILPYTYVLNVSRKWIKKFENINIPTPDMGSFDYTSMSSWSDISSSVYVPSSSSSSSSGGCSSCGGGCSSCGGGCSSCGGGGSW